MDRVNLFNPFGSRPDYENRLTWAFLVTLKYDVTLQNFLRELVESHLPRNPREDENIWRPARVSTQTKWIDSSTTPLISVLLTDEPMVEEIKVKWSPRRDPIYDGVIEYPNRMTLIIENKPYHGDVWREQLSPNKDSFSGDIDDDTLHDLAICLEWSEILEGVLKYTESHMPSFGNREIASDFLSFVGQFHPELTPYRSFRLCNDRPEALRKRTIRVTDDLVTVMGSDSDKHVESKGNYLARPGKIAARVYIHTHSEGQLWGLRVTLYPASTAKQADRFRKTVRREEFLALNDHEWTVVPNLNFSFRGTKLLWVTSPCGTPDYLDYFFSGKRPYGRKQWDEELMPLIEQWEKQGIIGPEDNNRIKHVRGNKTTLDVNPEFAVYREWDRDTVMRLEEQGQLAAHIIDALAVPLATWGETLGDL